MGSPYSRYGACAQSKNVENAGDMVIVKLRPPVRPLAAWPKMGAQASWREPGEVLLESTQRYFRVRRKDIAFLRFLLEACDGIAFMLTVEPLQGVVALYIPPGREAEVEAFMGSLQETMRIDPLPGGPVIPF
jgi:hypothetical protein